MPIPPSNRPWQNWDIGDTAKRIDQSWVGSPSEREIRATQARDIGATCGTGIPIFEVGCGTGLMGQELIAQGITSAALYTGGDVSQSMLAIGRQRLPDCRLLDLDVFDLSPIPPPDNVICLHVLQHLPHYRKALAQLLRFARKQLYIVTWFSASDADDISMGRDGPYEPIFNINRYGISGFLEEIRETNRPIAHLSEHPLVGEARAVHVVFGGGGTTSGLWGRLTGLFRTGGATR